MRQILILSGKGGTGKTTVASSFIKLAQAKLYADCDVDAPNLHLVVNAPPETITRDYYGLAKAVIDQGTCIHCDRCRQECRFGAIEIVDGNYRVSPYLCEGCAVCDLVCPADAIDMVDMVDGQLMVSHDPDKVREVFSTAELGIGSGTTGLLVTEVKKQLYHEGAKIISNDPDEIVILDGSPGIGCPVIASTSGVDLVLLVVEPSISGMSDMNRIVQMARHFQLEPLVCINKYDTNLEKSQAIVDYCQREGLELIAQIPFDKEAIRAVNEGYAVVDIDCPAGQAIRDCYEETLARLD